MPKKKSEAKAIIKALEALAGSYAPFSQRSREAIGLRNAAYSASDEVLIDLYRLILSGTEKAR